ncbi:MAG TPA: hypothetical protein VKT77_11130 [Chthonomonadaceae bacterium]|nr:hypothetical protein [Chthonomonadaceae bacterium]
MRVRPLLAAAAGLTLVSAACHASTVGLNTIPTTDLVPPHSWIGQIQNGNTQFETPSLLVKPDFIVQTQYSIGTRSEWGVDYIQPPDVDRKQLTFNFKTLLQNEDAWRPNVAVGVGNITTRQLPTYFLTFSKTLNYDQELRERFRAHHRRNRKLLGRRVHFGLTLDSHGAVEPFLGADLQMNDSLVFQTDWINGAGNAVTAGLAYVLPDQRTVVNPALLYSNSTHRIDGFFLNVGHQFNLK